MQDMILATILSLVFFVGAVLGANSAYEWRELISVPDILLHVTIDASLDLRDALAAIAVSSTAFHGNYCHTAQLHLSSFVSRSPVS